MPPDRRSCCAAPRTGRCSRAARRPWSRLGDDDVYPPASPPGRLPCRRAGPSPLQAGDAGAAARGCRPPRPARRACASSASTRCMVVPLRPAASTLGVAVLHPAPRRPDAFSPDDLLLAEELAARAAVCIDNARRYTRERSTALTLQRSLLPRAAARAVGRGGRLPLSARRRPGRGRRRLVRRHPAVRGPGRAGRRRRRRPRHPRLRHHGPAAHRRAHPRRRRPAARRAAHPPGRPGRPARPAGGPDARRRRRRPPGEVGATCLYAVYDPVRRPLRPGPGRTPAARRWSTPDGAVRAAGPAGRAAARARRTALRGGSRSSCPRAACSPSTPTA